MAEKNLLVETYRSVAAAWECDVMGHLTIACYFDRFTDAAFALIERLAPGVPPGVPPGAAWRAKSVMVRYQKELRAGDGMVARSGVIASDGDAVTIGHEFSDPGSGEVTTLVEHRLAARELPYGDRGEARQALAAAIAAWESPGFDPIAEPPAGGRAVATGRDRIKASEVDERGELALSGYVHRFAFACLHVCSAFGMTPGYTRANRRGFSTFETRLELLAPPPGAGDGVVLTSRLLAAGNSSLRMLHEMRHAASGAALARFHQAGVHFDMEARRSAPLPAELRQKAQVLLG